MSITALKAKAHLLRRLASEHDLSFEELIVPGEDEVIRFSFGILDESVIYKFAMAVPRDVYAYHGVIGE